jgi:ADP-ribosylglycohydrolase
MEIRTSADRYEGALLLSAIGDALGWPTEFVDPRKTTRLPFELPIKGFVGWKKLVGGKWWGYFDEIKPGDYSDDTQLTLAVARCISDSGAFEPDRFAYCELPLWLHYQRGGGRSVKAAARALIRGKAEWHKNFYRVVDLEYRGAGANGAAMRNLPIALASANNPRRLIRDSIFNSLITHGHPRAILASVLFGASIRYALSENDERGILEYLTSIVKHTLSWMQDERYVKEWIKQWESPDNVPKGTFAFTFNETVEETCSYLRDISKYLDRPEKDYYSHIGAFHPATKGSGIVTVCSAIFLFLKNKGYPEDALNTAVNLLGSDTDTIASFLGAMLGARYGRNAIPGYLEIELQDFEYLVKTAQRLRMISNGEITEELAESRMVDRKQAYLRLLAWEIGLHEMFWDAIEKGGVIAHPTLGKGIVTDKIVEPIPREDYIAKLLHVRFDCGQTCVFHSRVEKDGTVSESLAKDIEKALYPKISVAKSSCGNIENKRGQLGLRE